MKILQLAAALAAMAAPALAQAPSSHAEGFKLPEGRLQGSTGLSDAVFFIALDQTSKKGPLVDLWYFTVHEPAMMVGRKPVVQVLTHGTLDCSKRTYAELGVAGFSESGEIEITLPASAAVPVLPTDARGAMARALCDGEALPPTNIVRGHAAARQVARMLVKSGR